MKLFSPTDQLVRLLLQAMALTFDVRPKYRKLLKSTQGWIEFTIAFRTEDDTVNQAMRFKGGRVKVLKRMPGKVDATMLFVHELAILEMLTASTDAILNMILNSRIKIEGNHVCVLVFNYLLNILTEGSNLRKNAQANGNGGFEELADIPEPNGEMTGKRETRLKIDNVDPNVKILDDPYLSEYSLEDFPRLKDFLAIHFDTKPEVCAERPKLLTDWYIANGFEKQRNGKPWNPELRQGYSLKYVMTKKKPIIRENDLLPGTTTSKEVGVILYPDSHGTFIWAELRSLPKRRINPYDITSRTRNVLHHHVFPYWMSRNIKLWVGDKYDNPICQRLGDKFAVYLLGKSVALSHTVADTPKLLAMGTDGLVNEIETELEKEEYVSGARSDNALRSMIAVLEGVNAYAVNLSKQAAKEAREETDPARKAELERISEVCVSVPMKPAETLYEALTSNWITWIALHNENSNVGLSPGRMDQWLQPYFLADVAKLKTEEEKKKYVKDTIELIGCFYMRCTDHMPLIPDIGNYFFGGTASNQSITLGGVTPENEDGVNDMTYIFLKVTEMLAIRDPNINARFNTEINTDAYLKRLCEVNLITAATPAMNSDLAMMKSLEHFNYPIEDVRNWSATGCVEPTLSGKHLGNTGSLLLNLVAGFEMAMNSGYHPVMRWDVGPKTGRIEEGSFETFEDFFDAFKIQSRFLMDNAVQYNNYLGESHSVMRPTPLLSVMIDGCVKKGKDVTHGGAVYNTSGVACIGLADVTDSLMAIKKFVFDEKSVTFIDFKRAVDSDFRDDPALHVMVMNKTPRFGSGNEEAVEMANRVTKFIHDTFSAHRNFRGGKYTTGFWSMSNHVVFGTLTGTLPSGRLSGKSFTPGLTPEANASNSLLDNINDVAQLDPSNMDNNIAFNVKVVPSSSDTHAEAVDSIFSYVKTYFELGGMQIQLNVVTTAMLRDAMVHPENYRNLLVRISGYNTYFTTLDRGMQIELIERAEYNI